MKNTGVFNQKQNLETINIKEYKLANWNLSPAELIERSVCQELGVLADNGALVINTGKFTGRAPKDRFIVKDDITANKVNWGDINLPFDTDKFDALYEKMLYFIRDKEIYVRDAYACADENYRLNVRVVNEYPWQNLFANNLFLRPNQEELKSIVPDWHIVAIPSFKANPETDGTKNENFAIINFSRKMIIIGGTAYTGEMKKGIFSVLNFLLPTEHKVLPMHCSANVSKENGDTAIFFGLSGTGKTTLSADPARRLVGDDEHGWNNNSVFNFEGGNYAKVINLSAKGEPQIYNAIRFGALLENTKFHDNSRAVNYENSEITENTRVSYPIDHIDNAVEPSMAGTPENIFFLTCDAYGVIPPISRLTPGQAMYHFISGYTAKVAGTEAGITEPQTAFSACFGAPFMPLHPTVYAEMLAERMKANKVNVWLINTGWTGGPYGEGERMKLKYTRAMITAALNGELENVKYKEHAVFGVSVPQSVPNVPDEVLNPKNTWKNKDAYDQKANELAAKFNKNFEKYADEASEEILNAAPQIIEQV